MKTKGIYYLSVQENDKKWGLYTLGAGHGLYSPGEDYPAAVHSRNYLRERWEQGRTLQEFQLIYIHKGEGSFSYRVGETIITQKISAGDIFILLPEVWHTYKPEKRCGWEEYWIGFGGEWTNLLLQNNLFSKERLYRTQHSHGGVLSFFEEILHALSENKNDVQGVIRPLLLSIIQRSLGVIKHRVEVPFQEELFKIKTFMEENFSKHLNIENLLHEYLTKQVAPPQLSYSYFRKLFLDCFDVSPGKYLDQLRMAQAKKLLHMGTYNIKEISSMLGFQNAYYFSHFFKKHQGVSPKFFN